MTTAPARADGDRDRGDADEVDRRGVGDGEDLLEHDHRDRRRSDGDGRPRRPALRAGALDFAVTSGWYGVRRPTGRCRTPGGRAAARRALPERRPGARTEATRDARAHRRRVDVRQHAPVAAAVAEGLAAHVRGRDRRGRRRRRTTVPAGVDLLVVGGPTHAHGMTNPDTRRSAAQRAASALVPFRTGIREWLEQLAAGARGRRRGRLRHADQGPGAALGIGGAGRGQGAAAPRLRARRRPGELPREGAARSRPSTSSSPARSSAPAPGASASAPTPSRAAGPPRRRLTGRRPRELPRRSPAAVRPAPVRPAAIRTLPGASAHRPFVPAG